MKKKTKTHIKKEVVLSVIRYCRKESLRHIRQVTQCTTQKSKDYSNYLGVRFKHTADELQYAFGIKDNDI